MTRTRRSALTVLANVGGMAVVTALTFVTTPVIVRELGEVSYGVFVSAAGWGGVVGLLELGLGASVAAHLSRALGRDDRAGVAAGVRAGVRAYLATAGLMTAVSVPLWVALPWLTRTPPELVWELRAGSAIGLVGIWFLPLSVFRLLADASQRGYLTGAMATVQMVVGVLTAAGLAVLGWGLVGQFLAPVVAAVPFWAVLARDGLRRYPEVLAPAAAAAPEVGRAIWATRWPNLVFNAAGRFSLHFDPQTVALILGPAAVTPFALTQKVIGLVGAQVGGLGSAVWAGLLDLHHRGHHDAFALRLAQLTRLTAAVGGGLLAPVAAWNHALIPAWVNDAAYGGPGVGWVAAANAWMLGVISLWGWPLVAGGHTRAMLPYLAVTTGLNVGVSVAATAAVGLPGPLIGTAVTFAGVSGWWIPRLLEKFYAVSARGLVWAAVRSGLVAAAYAAGLAAVAAAVPPFPPDAGKWVKLACLAGWLAAGAVGFAPLAWWVGLTAADRAEWGPRVRAALPWGRRAPEREGE